MNTKQIVDELEAHEKSGAPEEISVELQNLVAGGAFECSATNSFLKCEWSKAI